MQLLLEQLRRRVVELEFEDKPLNYDAWDIDAYFASKSREVENPESVRVVESGPERAVGFATSIRNRRATYEIQFGSIDRPTYRNTSWEEAAFEVPAQRWADLSDAYYGVAVLSDCKHGYSVHEGTLWLSLLKGAIDPDPHADVGEHHFTYCLLPHAAGLEQVRKAAYGLTRPLLWRREAPHAGRLPLQFSLASTAEPGVLVETAQWAEDEDALILRLYEADGGATQTQLHLGIPADGIDEVDLLERNPRPVIGDSLDFRAREIKTLRIRPT
jgi:alpha-mannosidase